MMPLLQKKNVLKIFNVSNDIFTLMSFTFQAAQKSGRNAIAFDGAVENLNELSVKASAIARHHNTKFRPGIDGNILTMM